MKKLNTFIAIVFFLLCSIINKVYSQTPTPTIFYSNSTGALTSFTSWGTNTNGTGSNPSGLDFSDNTTHTFVIANRAGAGLQHSSVWSLSSSKLVVIGDGTTAISFTVGGAASAAINSVNIQTANNSTLVTTNNVNAVATCTFTNLHSNSWVIYNANNSNVNATTYPNLGISNNSSLVGNTTVTGTLNIVNLRALTLGSNSLTIMGFLSTNTSGSISTTSASGIYIGAGGSASGAIGTLRFVGASPVVGVLDINISNVASTVTLGSNVTFSGTSSYFGLFNGSLDLSSRSITVDPTSDFSCQSFASTGAILSNGGSIYINGSVGSSGSPNLFMDATSNTLKSLSVNSSGAQLNVSSTLLITDSLSVLDGEIITNGNITLTASSTLKGRLGRVGSGGVINGDITVETFIAGSSTGWANLGTNGVDGQTVKSWDTYSASAGANGVPMTCSGCDYDENALGSYFVSVKDWSESLGQYNDLTSSAALTPGKGFWVYVGDGLTSTSDLKLVNAGPAVTGSVGVALTSLGTGTNRGFNLVSNPYASPISWAKVRAASVTSTNISNAIYVWNADLNSGNGGYAEYVGGTSTPSGISGISDIIPAGQGFYVEAPLVASLLVFNESAKMTNNTGTNPLLKPATPSSIGKILRLKLNGSFTDWDETVFRIHDDATNVFDKEWDARKILQSPGYLGYPGPYSHYTTISSKDGLGEDYSIHSIPALTQSVSIPVMVRGMSTGNYTIAATEYADINDCIMIKDNLTNTTQDLKMGSYVFSLNDTTQAPRFELILCKDQSLEPTSVNKNLVSQNNQILISQDAQGAYVKTTFEKDTKAVISAYNIMGQQIINDIAVNGTVNTTYLPLNAPNQVVFIKVTSTSGTISKKILLH